MKKILATLLTLALFLGVVAFPAVADEQSDLLGNWEIESLSSGGMVMTKAELDANGMTMTVEFRADGTCTISMDGDAAECTYSLTSHTISAFGGDISFALTGGKLQFVEGSNTITLTKVGGNATTGSLMSLFQTEPEQESIVGLWDIVLVNGAEDPSHKQTWEFSADGKLHHLGYDLNGNVLMDQTFSYVDNGTSIVLDGSETAYYTLTGNELEIREAGIVLVLHRSGTAALTGSGTADASALIGGWKMTGYSENGQSMELINDLTYEFTADGQMIQRLYEGKGGPLYEMDRVSYELAEDGLYFYDDDYYYILQVELIGNQLVLTEDTVVMTFTRTDKP